MRPPVTIRVQKYGAEQAAPSHRLVEKTLQLLGVGIHRLALGLIEFVEKKSKSCMWKCQAVYTGNSRPVTPGTHMG